MDQLIVLNEIYDSFSKGLERIKSINPGSIEGRSSEQVGRLLEGAKLGKIDQDISSDLLDRFNDIYEMKRLGDICRKAGHYAIAVKSYNKALSKNNDQSIRPVLLSNLGQVYVRSGDLGSANNYYKKAFDCFESMSDSSGMAHVLGNMSVVYRKGKDWDNAIDHCYRSLKIFEGLGDELGIARATGSLGRIYVDMGEQDLATRYFDKSLNDFRRLGDKRSVAWIWDRLGQISTATKNWDEAVKYYNKSITAFEELGQDQSMGIVMSNLGRMYLEKGDPTAAIDHLEKGIKLMKRDMQPAYQNTAEYIAAAYGTMATMHMQGVDISGQGSLGEESGNKLKQASQLYARSSDRYLEIASSPGFDLPELKVSSSIMRSLSYLSRLKAEPLGEEAVALAERAASALDSAVINSEGSQKDNIEAFQKNLFGVREALSSYTTENEPWRLTKSIAKSVEYFISGASNSSDIGRCLCDALKGLNSAIEAEKNRSDPSVQLKPMVSNLEKAKSALESSGTIQGSRNAQEIGRAIKLADNLMNTESKGSTASSYRRVSDSLNYKAYRDILLIVGQVLVDDAVSKVKRIDRVYVWDDSFTSKKRFATEEPAVGKLNEYDSRVSACSDQLSWSVPEAVELEDAGFDDSIKIIKNIAKPKIEKHSHSPEVSLVSVQTEIERSPAQVVMLPKWEPKKINAGITGIDDTGANPEDINIWDININEINSGDVTDDREKSDNNAEARGRVPEISDLKSIFSQNNGIKLIKAMIVVVLVLLLMDAILYLI